jgi:glycosyltransferase involved in cell wall biosynthesis
MAASEEGVCVVMPVLNEKDYIREAVESLMAQEYAPLEIIVYDGGSADGTLDILKEYPLEVVEEVGLRQMAAINRGWRRTTAPFVTWMAGDDRLKPGAIGRLVNELRQHPEAAVAHGDAEVIDANGAVLSHISPGQVQLPELTFWFSLMPQSTVIRRAALERSGIMDETRRFAADYDLFLRLAQYYTFHYVPFVAAQWRSHAASEDARNYEMVGDAVIDVVDGFFQRADLTEVQRSLWPRARTGSRCFAGGNFCLVGKRVRALSMLWQALQGDPSLLWRTRQGRHFLLRLMSPVQVPPFRLKGGRSLVFRGIE